MKSILLVLKGLGLFEMTSGLVNASFSSPERQAVKMIFFAPCTGSHTDIQQLCDNQNVDGRATLLLLPQDWIVISHVFRFVSTTFYKQSNF